MFIILGAGCQKTIFKNSNVPAISNHSTTTKPINALDKEDRNPNTLLTTTTTYKNTRAGFQITLPAGWYVPSEDNLDPHFYSCQNYECEEAFEVQGLNLWQENSSNFISQTYEQEIKELREFELEPFEINNLIPNAKVIKAFAHGTSHGAEYSYSIFYSLNEKEFWISVKGKSFEKYILSTFKRL